MDTVACIARDVATKHADEVDRDARFPIETIDALRQAGALAAFVPRDRSGMGAPLEDIAACCFELARGCAASAMVFAMHQIQVACICRHLDNAPWFDRYLTDLVENQPLIASITSEVGTGGDIGRSIAAVEGAIEVDRSRFEKQAPTVSYGAHADDFLTTVCRSPDSEPSDQVVVLTRRDQTELEQLSVWDPLGMRGTCSPGFVVKAQFVREQILTTPFSRVLAETMMPTSHILWSHTWLGLATESFERARSYVRAQSKRGNGLTSLTGRLSALSADLALLRSEVRSGLNDYMACERDDLSTLAATIRFNTLKVATSEQAVRVCEGALRVCGIAGYQNNTPFSVGRQLRDVLSGPLMIANERIHETTGTALLVAKDV